MLELIIGFTGVNLLLVVGCLVEIFGEKLTR